MLGDRNYEYVYGFLIASVAAGIISLAYPNDKNGLRAVRLDSPDDSLTSAIVNEWNRRIKSKSERKRKLLEQYAPKISDYFIDHAPPKDS